MIVLMVYLEVVDVYQCENWLVEYIVIFVDQIGIIEDLVVDVFFVYYEDNKVCFWVFEYWEIKYIELMLISLFWFEDVVEVDVCVEYDCLLIWYFEFEC